MKPSSQFATEQRFYCPDCQGFGYLNARGDRRMITYPCPRCSEQRKAEERKQDAAH